MPVPEITLSGSALTGIAPNIHSLMGPSAVLPSVVKLGRRRPRSRPLGLSLENYFDPTKAAPPVAIDYGAKARASLQRMYLNDQYGCCVISGKYHAVGVWTANDTPKVIEGTDQEVYDAYQTICGPGDNGCLIDRVLLYMQKTGLLFNGIRHKIDGFVMGNWTNKLEVMTGEYIFGACSIGFNLPESWTNSAIWDVTNSRIVGGHDVTIVGYNADGVQVSSWGRVYTITWRAFTSRMYIEELYYILSPDWTNSDKLAPNGIDAQRLAAHLKIIGGGGIPPIDPSLRPWESILPAPEDESEP